MKMKKFMFLLAMLIALSSCSPADYQPAVVTKPTPASSASVSSSWTTLLISETENTRVYRITNGWEICFLAENKNSATIAPTISCSN